MDDDTEYIFIPDADQSAVTLKHAEDRFTPGERFAYAGINTFLGHWLGKVLGYPTLGSAVGLGSSLLAMGVGFADKHAPSNLRRGASFVAAPGALALEAFRKATATSPTALELDPATGEFTEVPMPGAGIPFPTV